MLPLASHGLCSISAENRISVHASNIITEDTDSSLSSGVPKKIVAIVVVLAPGSLGAHDWS